MGPLPRESWPQPVTTGHILGKTAREANRLEINP